MTRLQAGLALALLASSVLPSSSRGDGTLDLSFGRQGIVVTPFRTPMHARANAVALQPDGKIVLGGTSDAFPVFSPRDFTLARFDAGGGLDRTFGTEGFVTSSADLANEGDDVVQDLVVQGDGKILAAGTARHYHGSSSSMALLRYEANGAPDPAFGSGGMVLLKFRVLDDARALAIQADGKILLAGSSRAGDPESPGPAGIALARLWPDGTLDGSFNSVGKVTTHFENLSSWGQAIAVQPDGRIVVAAATSAWPDAGFLLVRYNPNGSLDRSFGTAGQVMTRIGRLDATPEDLAIQTDGRIVVVGKSLGWFAARFEADGRLDTSFGSNGVFRAGSLGAKAVVIQPDGKLVLAGYGEDSSLALTRLLADGTVDGSFGSQGWARARPAGTGMSAAALVLRANGDLLVGGSVAIPEAATAFAVAAFDGTGAAVTGFGADGASWAPFSRVLPSVLTSAVVLRDGRIVVAGYAGGVGGRSYAALARYLPDGALDPTFGKGGTLLGSPPSGAWYDRIDALALQPDGKLLIAGRSSASWAVGRLLEDGRPDPDFGSSGSVVTRPGVGAVAFAHALAIQPDGGIVVAGSAGSQLAIGRFDPAGRLDPTFGSGGVVLETVTSVQTARVAVSSEGRIVATNGRELFRYDAGGYRDLAFGDSGVVRGLPLFGDHASLSLLPDGRVLLGGSAAGLSTVLGFRADGSPDPTFGTAGKAGGGLNTVTCALVLPDGRIVLGGDGLRASRLGPDGARDGAFGFLGYAGMPVPIAYQHLSGALALHGAGFLIAGTRGRAPENRWMSPGSDFALARFVAVTPVELQTFVAE